MFVYYKWWGNSTIAETFKILPDILSRPAALPLEKPFKSLTSLPTDTSLKRSILDSADLTNVSNEELESSIEL